MSHYAHAFGAQAEDSVAHYLQACGYEIIGNNWYEGHKEIDLIAKLKQQTIFVEVKAGNEKSDPFFHFTKRKQRDLSLAINAYLDQADLWETDFRADLITLTFASVGNIVSFHHYEDVI